MTRGDHLGLRAAAYIRVSTLDQTEFSPDAQLKQIKEYAMKHDMVLANQHIYADEGISGRSTDKRVAFNRMIRHARKKPKPFDVILIHKFNRFARNREDAIIFKSLLKRECSIKVISITEPIEDDKIGIIIESVLDAFSEYYSINLSEEVKKGMGEKASRGGVQTRPPYGYTIKNNQLVLVNKEANIVRFIYDKFLNEGYTYIDIAKELNNMGIKTKNGNLFQSKSIKYILTNPTYKGYLVWNRKEKSGKIRQNSEWIMAKGDFEPIISDDIYHQVQNKIDKLKKKSPKHTKPSNNYKHILSGIMSCKECGSRMVFCKSNGYSYFRCRKAKEGGCTIKKSVRADILEEVIFNQIDNDWSDIELTTTDIDINKDDQMLITYKHQLKNVKNKLALAKQAYLNSIDSLEEYEQNKATLLKEQVNLESSLQTVIEERKHNDKRAASERWRNISIFLNGKSSICKINNIIKSFVKEIVLDIRNDAFEIIYFLEEEI